MQWTVDNLDSGGGLMANKNKILVSESDGDVFVGTISDTFVGSLMGGAGKVPLVQKLNYLKSFLARVPEFKPCLKYSRFSIFLNPSFPPESEPNF